MPGDRIHALRCAACVRTMRARRVNKSAVVRPHLCVLNTVPVTQGVLAQLSLVWDVSNTYPFDDWSAIV